MRHILFTLPVLGLPIYGYGLMLFFAFLGSMNLAAWRARREKLDPEIIYDLALWVFLGGLAGARLLYVWQYWGVRVKTFADIFKIWEGGIVFYGSVLGGLIAFLAYWRARPFPLRPTLDAIAPSLALGIALGRIGCFLNGCCYGDQCDPSYPFGVRFPAQSSPWADQVRHGVLSPESAWSLPVHPTQLYSTLDGLLLLALLTAFYPLRRKDGEVMGLLMLTYPVTRFLIERLRNDEGAFFLGMTISQNISVLLLFGGFAYWAWLARLPATRYADTAASLESSEASVGETASFAS